MDKDFVGVFSRKDKSRAKVYYFVWTADEMYSVQKLNAFYQPIEMLKTIDAASFVSMFTHEPDIKKYPKGVRDTVAPKQRSLVSAEEVESSLRELFRKALVRMKRSGPDGDALPILNNLLEVKEGITPQHRHMFRDFGTEMRKKKCYEQAAAFAQRTLELTHNDDHAHFNLARVFIEMGNYDEAEQHILTAQFINPDSRIYRKTLRYIALLRLQKEQLQAATPSFVNDLK